MNRRVEFTMKLCCLLHYAFSRGYSVVIDWVLRDAETQNRLFKEGKSKCDGYKVKSKHQLGLAADLYILDNAGNIVWDKKIYEELHEVWERLGGKKMIEWDLGHFEI